MSVTYSSFVSEIATLTAISSNILVNGDTNFAGIMPGIIDYAEGRCYRDLDLPAARVTDTSVTCSSGVRSIALSTTQGTILVVERLNILSSAGATSSFAQRNVVYFTSPDYIDAVFGSAASSNTGLPLFAARVTDTQVIFGPTPDQAYGTEVVATIRPNTLSAANTSTWLTQNVPELFTAAGMVFAAGHMRDFGAQSDNPQMAQSWETQYNALLKSASVDALRMKFQSQAWSNQIPSPIATPPRV